ncbi:PREDICTED: transcription factor HIVEP3 [Nipponia nippon]|uniref:transcription factor HIVEP3 n=1 Tax=Nipponia nippon TaxID=128390 RepID=UPI000510DAD0|nr:PREDICTED: transcription factor HIVEP3 [Nipponia nippon]
MERIGGEDFEEPTEGESTDSEEETGAMSGHSFDIKSGSSSQLDASKVLTSHGEKIKPEQSLLSLQQSHSATETVPLLRSHSMPSAACTISSPHTFRGSYSFDDHIMEPEVLSRSQAFSSHPRMLKRQPAIELPLGVEYVSEEVSSANKETVSKPPEEPETKESDLTKKSRKGPKVKGFMYECNICGARYKKRDNYEAHKKYYCSELQLSKPRSSTSHTSSETEKSVADPDTWPQMMHYKLGSSLELTPLRKRRKEKSLGDDEEPPAFELSDTPSSSTGPGTQFANLASSDVALNLTRESIKSPADPGKSTPSDASASFHSRSTKLSSSAEGKERRTTSKEISVIQHTSSFEKSDSIEQASSLEGEEKPLSQYSSQPTPQHSRPPHSLQPKLVRQPNIQVPEILVTEEPDRPEMEPEPPPKEPEKTEEFQWPQRSQTLSQLPAEKLPPKKKRLRLAEMAQSSGESSFESVSLTRSPSQESSISHGSSHSVSFDREDHSKSESTGQPSESHPKPPGIGSHMLMVPSHHHHSREMRRSASEQTPNVSHPSQMSETRSKSFDYGSLSSTPASTAGPSASSAPQERRKCFLVRQASLTRHPEHEPDLGPTGRPETEDSVPSSSRKDITRAEKEEDKRGKSEEEALVTKRGEPVRIKIFEGGYKSNEEYVYVRGRGRGKYVCEECGIRCKKPSMLKKHIRTHTDVRPYVCKYCNFAFKTKGNLTKHMKSKAHSKKCQEMGVLVSSLVDLEAEEVENLEDLFQDSEGREGSEPTEEHQFSDLEESDDDDDNEDEEDEEEEESQDEPPLKLPEGKHTTLAMHSSGGSPSSQEEGTEIALSLAQETVSSSQKTSFDLHRTIGFC